MLLVLVISIILGFEPFLHCDAGDLYLTVPKVGTLQYSSTTSAQSSKIIYQFQGVRFAESPTGSNRFKVNYWHFLNANIFFLQLELLFQAPVPAFERSEIQNVTEKKGDCPSMQSIANMTVEEMTVAEDCLHLSIYTKSVRNSYFENEFVLKRFCYFNLVNG